MNKASQEIIIQQLIFIDRFVAARRSNTSQLS